MHDNHACTSQKMRILAGSSVIVQAFAGAITRCEVHELNSPCRNAASAIDLEQRATMANTNYAEFYKELATDCKALMGDERDMLINSANFAAFVFQTLPRINWAGFYLRDGRDLSLGPFQGKPACTRITFGKRVCGTAYATNQALLVEDVHAFEGHIACDPASRSEVVIPLADENGVYGVFDVDSPDLARFSEEDRVGLETLVEVYMSSTDIRPLFAQSLTE